MTERQEAYEAAARMCDTAAALLEAAGFTADISSLGDARYFTKPGSDAKIRVATYFHAHPDQVDLTFDRDRCLTGWYLTDSEIEAEVAGALKDYDELVEYLADEEE